jgi:hypothetical protein
LGTSKAKQLEILRVGSRDQQVLHRAGDDLRIDWGYFYLAVRQGDQATTVTSRDSMTTLVQSGSLPSDDDMDMAAPATRWGGALGRLCALRDHGESEHEPAGLARL